MRIEDSSAQARSAQSPLYISDSGGAGREIFSSRESLKQIFFGYNTLTEFKDLMM
jgi:hypothetical protein